MIVIIYIKLFILIYCLYNRKTFDLYIILCYTILELRHYFIRRKDVKNRTFDKKIW